MKKPNFIQVRFKSTLSPAVKRYFNHQVGKTFDFNFGSVRTKKIFEYRLDDVGDQSLWDPKSDQWYKYKDFFVIGFKLKVPRGDLPKVPLDDHVSL